MSFGDSWVINKNPFIEGYIIGKGSDGIAKSRVAKFLLDTGGSSPCIDYKLISKFKISFIRSITSVVAGGTLEVPTPIFRGIQLIIPVFDRDGMCEYEISETTPFRIGTINIVGKEFLHKTHIDVNYFKLNPVKIMNYA